MKNIFKFTPLALGFLALASCSSDDFLGSAEISGKQKLVVTVESPNDELTRSAFVAGTMQVMWQNGDQFRVYDEMLQKFDVYKWEGEAAILNGTKRVDAHKKAIFPGDNVYYAGYDNENDIVTAIMTVPSVVDFGGAEVKNGLVGYVSNLPMWGDVTKESDEELQVGLARMTGYTDITLYHNADVKAIRVLAVAEGKTVPTTGLTTDKSKTISVLDATTPLSGNFEAQLYENGVLVANLSNPVVKDSYESYIQVNIGELNYSQENHIYIPLITGTYKNLVIQYTKDDESASMKWTTLKEYKNQTVQRNQRYLNGLEIGDAPITAIVTSLADLNAKLKLAKETEEERYILPAGSVLNVTTEDGGPLKVVKDDEEIVLPTCDLTINLNCKIENAIETSHLNIKGGTSGKTVTLNILGGISGHKNIELNQTCNLILGGELMDNGEGHTEGDAIIKVYKATTFGDGIVVPFSTNMPVELYGAGVTVDAGTGTIDKIYNNTTKTNTVTVKSGTVNEIGVSNPTAGAVTVEDGNVGEIKSTGSITVSGGKVGTLTTTTGKVTVTGGEVGTLTNTTGIVDIKDAKVTTVTTETPTINVTTAEVETLNANCTTAKKPAITVTGGVTVEGTDEVALAKIGTLNLAANNTAVVTSTGKAAIVTIKNSATATFTSTWNDKNIAVDNTLIGSAGEIYTAAQLAGLGTGTQKSKYKLMANVTIESGKDWTPVNNNKSFDGNAKFIDGLNAPLFGIVKGGTIVIGGTDNTNKLTLKNVNINTTEGNQGALAKEISGGTVTIQNVEVTADKKEESSQEIIPSVIGAAKGADESVNIGGLVGKATGTVKLIDNKVSATINGYANVGGYIGNYAGTNITMSVSDAKKFVSAVKFGNTKTPSVAAGTTSNPLAGTFGYFVGSLTTTAKTLQVNIIKTEAYSGDVEFGNYFTADEAFDNNIANNFKNNKYYVEGDTKPYLFVGMSDHEIGYSPAPAAALKKYVETDLLGRPVSYTIDDINIFKQ